MLSSLKSRLVLTIVILMNCVPWVSHAQNVLRETQDLLDREIENYIGIYATDHRKTLKQANESLMWSGISDQELFDRIADRIQSNDVNNRVLKLLVEAIAYSGDPKYNSTLRRVIDTNRSVTNTASEALAALTKYQQWNQIISNGIAQTNYDRVDERRVINMITSGIPELEWAGAKQAFIGYSLDKEVANAARDTLAASYNEGVASGTHIDAMAYLIKLLIGDQQSTALFEEIYRTAAHKKLKRYAEDALKRVGIKPS
jgi:hypothetical protein